MNRYRIGLSVSVVLFVVIAIFSSVVGVGLLQGFLILVSSILLLGIFIGGIAGLGAKDFWWEYFKPKAAIPISWGLLHLGFALMLPDVSKECWVLYWKLLMVIELSVFVLCLFLNKRVPFEKRTSRRLLTATYVLLFFITPVTMISCRLFAGEFAANLNRAMLFKLLTSKVELIEEDIEKLTKAYRAKPALEKLDELREGAKKLDQLDENEKVKFFSELEKMETWKTEVQRRYAVPDEKKPNWDWLFGKPAEARVEHPRPKRHLFGTFKLPADGRIVSQDLNGQELWYQKGELVRFQQLGSPRKFTVVNKRSTHDSWSTNQTVRTSGQTRYSDKIQLMAAEGKEITVQVRIIPRS